MYIILLSAFAGIFGTGLGGLISAVMTRHSSDTACWMLSFAGGVMVSIVCFGLVPESIELADSVISVIGLVSGIIIVMVLNRLIDKITETRKEKLTIHQTPEELHHESQIISGRSVLLRSGMIMLAAISLHNIPEGMAIGAGGSHDFQLGVLLALMIALHNIPEGMAIAAPLLSVGIHKGKVILLTAFSGASTLIGGAIGFFIGNISDTTIALSFSIAGGAMLYIVFGEILPQSIIMTKSRLTTIITLIGFVIGFVITRI